MPIKIRGKQYLTVAERLSQIHTDHHGRISIQTQLISHEKTLHLDLLRTALQRERLKPDAIERILGDSACAEVIVTADVTIHGDDGQPTRTFVDMAHEREDRKNPHAVNATSYLENAATSAIGRALAAAGYAGSEYASADELAGALADADGDLIQKVRQMREQLNEARETENALKHQLTEAREQIIALKKRPLAIQTAEGKVAQLMDAHQRTDKRIAALMATCQQMVGAETVEAIGGVIPRQSEIWTKTEAILLLAICHLHQEQGEKSDATESE